MLYGGGTRKNARLNRIVLEAFVGPQPPGKEAAHINGDRLDNRASNLEWVAHTRNCEQRIEHGAQSSVLTNEQVAEVLAGAAEGVPALALRFGVSRPTIRNILSGKFWKGLEFPRRARRAQQGPRGERSGHARLTADGVVALRADFSRGVPLSALALRFGVTKQTAHEAAVGKTWAHIPGAVPVGATRSR